MRSENRVSQNPLARYGAVMGVCAAAGAVAGGVSAVFGESGPTGVVVVAVVTGLAMALALWSCTFWWRGLDEAAQEAHKWAWWWGSTFGMAIGGVALFTLVMSAEDALGGSAKDLLLGGAAIIVGFQTVGYAIAWAAWWLRRR